jgi:apolipoprotein N-acyltransferase
MTSCRLAGLASGLLLAVPPLWSPAAPLQLAALLPALFVIARGATRRAALTAGLYTGLAYTIPQIVVVRLDAVSGVGLLLYLTLLWAGVLVAARSVLRGPPVGGAFAFGALLVLADWLNFTCVPVWGTAQSFARPWSAWPAWIQFVSLTGITGVLFVVGSLQALLVTALARPAARRRAALAGAALLAAAAGANAWCGLPAPAGTLRVAAVGLSRADYARDVQRPGAFDALVAGPVAAAAADGARLVVTPEAVFSAEADKTRTPWFQRLCALARTHGVVLVAGYIDGAADRNRIVFIGPDGRELAEYTKTHLTPIEPWGAGDGTIATVEVDGVRTGGLICHDDNYTDLSRAYGRLPTALLAVPTQDWAAVRHAHFQSSLHRAIEGRCGLVRAAIDGISAIVSPRGRVLARRDHTREGSGLIVADVPLAAARTPFSRWGHWPAPAALLLAALQALRGHGTKKRPPE